MDAYKLKRIGKFVVKALFGLLMVSILGAPFFMGGPRDRTNPLSHKQVKQLDGLITKVFTTETVPLQNTYTQEDIIANIKNFVETPDGGAAWDVFGETVQHDYSYKDEDGMEWSGVRPEFSDALKALDGTDILIQGYMFPLGQSEKQELFLLGPFPVSCPFHYHVTPNLIIEVHAKTPVAFSYDPVTIKGTLELVPTDDDYNVFYRLNEATLEPAA